MNIGDKINYLDEYGESIIGTIQGVFSDMDSYDEMKLKDGVSYYVSKKKTAAENLRRKKAKKPPLASPVFAAVKPKNLASVFLEIVPSSDLKGIPDYVLISDITGRSG
jgi:hypothetical protein